MPFDQPTTNALNNALQSLQTASNELTKLLGGATPAPDKRIEILQKNFEQLSHYDRHYSTTRSALTTLLVTVGLVVAHDPLQALWVPQAVCVATDAWSVMTYIVRNFAVTLLLFFLAFPVNLYFRKLTLACNLIEHTISREIAEILGLPDIPSASARIRRVPDPPVRGYYFSDDLRRVVTSLKWPWFDAMTNLLMFAEAEFLIILVLVLISHCGFWSNYYGFALAIPPALGVAIFAVAAWLARRRRTRGGL
jgi:hypothetical protein